MNGISCVAEFCSMLVKWNHDVIALVEQKLAIYSHTNLRQTNQYSGPKWCWLITFFVAQHQDSAVVRQFIASVNPANGFYPLGISNARSSDKLWARTDGLSLNNTVYITHGAPFTNIVLTSISAWITNHIPSRVLYEIIYPFPNFNCSTVEVWEWISNFFPHNIMVAIICPCGPLS